VLVLLQLAAFGIVLQQSVYRTTGLPPSRLIAALATSPPILTTH
jgi:hypothetical protein